MARTSLNTAHPLHGRIVFAMGDVDGGSGNVRDLVSNANIGVLGENCAASADPTHGTIYTSNGVDSGINFGDIAALDGLTNCSIFIFQRSTVGLITANTPILDKTGSNPDTVGVSWLSSENVNAFLETADGAFGSTGTDMLHETSGEDPTQWHSIGYTRGANLIARVNDAQGTPTAITGAVVDSSHDLRLHPNLGQGVFAGDLAHFVIFDGELTNQEWSDLTANPNLLYAASAATLSNPDTAGISDTQVTLQVATDQPEGYGTATGYVVLDTVANLDGVTIAQVKAGQNDAGAAALAAGTVNITASPFQLALTGLSLTIGDTYSFAWVQTNNNGDSNLLVSQFVVAGININSVTAQLVPGQTATVNASLVGTAQGTVEIEDSNHTIVQAAITAWPAGTGSGDIEFTVPDAIGSNLKPGAVTVRVINNAADDSEEIVSALQINSGWVTGVIAGQKTTADAYLDATPAPQEGHSVGWTEYLRLASDDSITTYPVTVILNELTYRVPGTVPAGLYYFDYTFYDENDHTWDTTPARRTVNLQIADVTPDAIDLGADITGVDPGSVTIRNYTLTGIDPGIGISLVAGGNAQVSTDGLTPAQSISRENGETYYVHFTAPGSGDSAVASLNANGVTDELSISARAAIVPTIDTHPEDATVEVGSDATFTIAGQNINSIQWRIDGVDIAGATGLSYTRTTVAGDLGTQTIDAVVQSTDGVSATSNGASLVVASDLTPPVFTDGLNASNVQTNGLTVGFTVNEAATVSGIAVAQGSAVPTPAQIIAGVDYSAETVLSTFSVNATADTATVAAVSNITGFEGQQVTVYAVAVDSAGNVQLQAAVISVTATLSGGVQNDAPVIGANAAYSIPENQPFSINITIDNLDGELPTLNGADAALLSIALVSGNIYQITGDARDFEAPDDADANNVYDVQVVAGDGVNSVVTHDIAITVTNVVESLELPPINRTVEWDNGKTPELVAGDTFWHQATLREGVDSDIFSLVSASHVKVAVIGSDHREAFTEVYDIDLSRLGSNLDQGVISIYIPPSVTAAISSHINGRSIGVVEIEVGIGAADVYSWFGPVHLVSGHIN